jgi:hydrogenase expression/formation protein HypE
MSAISFSCPRELKKYPHIVLGHGSGGQMTQELIDHLFVPLLYEGKSPDLTDAAVIKLKQNHQLAYSTDSFVIKPFIFPGGDIGSLSIHGTLNDLSSMGAVPKYISVGFILEEGLSFDTLSTIVHSMGQAARKAGVKIITGDTKVVEAGHGDGVYINTTGIGILDIKNPPHPKQIKSGDVLLVNGTLGDHGMAIMSVRENLSFETSIVSDSASLHSLVQKLMQQVTGVHAMRDLTRGGLASVLNELAYSANVGIKLDEATVPLNSQVKSACEIMGLDPLFVANEGKMLFILSHKLADKALATLKRHPLGRQAAIIGRVVSDHPKTVVGLTSIGSQRVIDVPAGVLLPRIC